MVDFRKLSVKKIKDIFGPKQTKKALQDEFKELKRYKPSLFKSRDDNAVLLAVKKYYDNKNVLKELYEPQNEGKLVKITTRTGDVMFFTVNRHFLAKLDEAIKTGSLREERNMQTFGSDAQLVNIILDHDIEDIAIGPDAFIEDEETEPIYERATGSFFKYYCKIDMDLKRYGILKSFDEEYYKHNCIYHAFEAGKMSIEKLEELKIFMKDSHLSICKLGEVANKLDIKIIFRQLRKDDSRLRKTEYGKNENEVYEIALIDDHYFIYETTNITSYAIDHYDEVKDEPDFNKIFTKEDNRYKRNDKRFIKSTDLFLRLLENEEKLLTLIKIDENIMKTPYYNKVDEEIKSLEYSDESVEEFIDTYEPSDKPTKTYYFDFETVTTGDIHKPYMVHYCDEGSQITKSLIDYNEHLGSNLLQKISLETPKKYDIVLIAHNMRYDLSFLSRYLYSVKTIEAGNRIIGFSGTYYIYKNKQKIGSRVIKIKDSYSMISMKLADFNKTFQLGETKKELINYDMYNDLIPHVDFKSYQSFLYPIDDAIEKYYKDDKDQFLENIKKWNLKTDDKFDFISYASRYCEQDVLTLKNGYLKFRDWLLDLYNIDIKYKYSISGVADQILKNKGCYDECYTLSGIPRKFISQAVIGGRTMSANNKKKIYGNIDNINFDVSGKDEEMNSINTALNDFIADFDGVSLYPSSMYRINGFIKGKPKVFDNTMTYDSLLQKDYYFVEIIIKKIGIKRAFSLMSIKNEDHIRMFNNDMIGHKIVVDKISLEDLIEFQKISFEIVRGYYFDDGFNDTITDVIKTMFEERAKQKKTGNPIQIVYKLLMNSAYGKTILKESETSKRYYNNAQMAIKYMKTNYNNVIMGTPLYNDKKFVVQVRNEINSHKNFCHIGSMILSMSKRIMNEVICTAEDNNIPIFYQDTDSMHLYNEDISKLEQIYNRKYERELIGSYLGQFHSDFEMSKKDAKNIFSKACIILGKKCYLDVLKAENYDDFEIHARLKGISNKSLIYTAKKLYGYETDTMNVIKLYRDLYEGENIEFDLSCDGSQIRFETVDLIVRNAEPIKRTLVF